MHKICSKPNKCICWSLNIYSRRRRRHHHHHHHHLHNMQLGHLFTRSGVASPEVCLMVCLGSFAFWSVDFQNSRWTIIRAFCLHVATSLFCILVFCPKLGLYLFLLQSLCLFCNISKCILLFFLYMSSPLLLFFLRLLLEWSSVDYRETELEGPIYCSVFYCLYFTVFVKVFYGLNILFIMSVIFK